MLSIILIGSVWSSFGLKNLTSGHVIRVLDSNNNNNLVYCCIDNCIHFHYCFVTLLIRYESNYLSVEAQGF